MKAFSRLSIALLLAAAALSQACVKNQTEVAVENLIVADRQNQTDALSEAVTLLGNDGSSCISVMESIVKSLTETTDPENLYSAVSAMQGASPDLRNRFSDLIAKYRSLKGGTNEQELELVLCDIEALVAGEVARAQARIADVKAAGAANRSLASSIITHVGALEALSGTADSFDKYRTLTVKSNQLLSSVSDALKAFYPSGAEYSADMSAVSGKLADDFLKAAFGEYTKFAAAKQELTDVQNSLEAMVAVYSAKLKTTAESAVSKDLEDRVTGAEDGLSKVTGDLEALDKRLGELESTVSSLVDQLSFAEGDLKGYIDGAIAAALTEALEEAEDVIYEYLSRMYFDLIFMEFRMDMVLSRIQSIVYVPDYDDLKISLTTDVIRYGEKAILVDRPMDITYQILPAQYASAVAQSIQSFYASLDMAESLWDNVRPDLDFTLDSQTPGELLRAICKEYGFPDIVCWFDVKAVKTRSGGSAEDLQYGLRIVDVVSADDNTGEITFRVQPVNMASQNLLNSGYEPGFGYSGQPAGTVPVWGYNDLASYSPNTAFAVQLRMYHLEDYDEIEVAEEEYEYTDYENELASSYTAIYSNLEAPVELLPEAYVSKEGTDGHASLEPLSGEYQYLPYNVFRKDATEAEPGYRTILAGITPAFSVGGQIVSAQEMAELGYDVSGFDNPAKEFELNGTAEGAVIVSTDNDIEVEMDPEASEAVREAAIGSTVEGKYVFDTPFGKIEYAGTVEIVRDMSDVPGEEPTGYDLLHLSYYTFNSTMEKSPFIQHFDFAANDGTVEWWTQCMPHYYVETPSPYHPDEQRVSYRYALADYDPGIIDLSELAFNVVDQNDDVLSDDDMEEAGLEVRFVYDDPELAAAPLPAENVRASYNTYGDLWDTNTLCFNTNEYPFLRVKALLYQNGEELPTRFSRPKKYVKDATVNLDYSSFAVVGWVPFKDLTSEDISFRWSGGADILSVPVYHTVNLKDNRPNGLSFDVIKDGEWIIGDVASFDASSSTPPKDKNGYIKGITSKDAYHIKNDLEYEFSMSQLPKELRRLIRIVYSPDGYTFSMEPQEGYYPYIQFDPSPNVEFSGSVVISAHVTLRNPWQPPLETDFDIIISSE
ncbi:MAG: hypothetical protein IKZ91_03660 [Bacteroidales bacterium]|nr:hypothetical protein [Bacteroidales bacterium]